MVEKLFPEIAIRHTTVYQADHCFTRGNKHLFFEPANGTMVCAGCNMAKHYDNKSVKRAIDMIVIYREGEEKFLEMMDIDMKMSANHDWNKVWWQEEQQEKLLKTREKLMPKEDNGDWTCDVCGKPALFHKCIDDKHKFYCFDCHDWRFDGCHAPVEPKEDGGGTL